MQMNNQVTMPTSFYRLPKVRELCGGVSASTIWAWAKNSSTGFPRPIKLSESCTVWNAADIEAWARSRIAAANNK